MKLKKWLNSLKRFMEPQSELHNLMKMLKDYWFLILFMGMLVIGWTNIVARQNTSDSDLRRLEIQIDNQGKQLDIVSNNLNSLNVEIGKQIAEINANVNFIRQQVQSQTIR